MHSNEYENHIYLSSSYNHQTFVLNQHYVFTLYGWVSLEVIGEEK